MVDINKTLDGTLEKAISASAQLNKMPGALQSFILGGDFAFGGAKKVKSEDLGISKRETKFDSSNNSGIQNLAAQLAGLDKSQQSAVFRMSDLSKEAQNVTQSLLGEAAAGKQLSGVLVENQLKTLNLTQSTRERILQETGLIDSSGKYRMAAAADVKSILKKQFAMQDCSGALKSAGQNEEQLASTIVTTVAGQQAQTAATWAQKFAIDALAGVLAVAKQALIAFAVGFAVKKIQEWYKSVTEVDDKLVELADDMKKTADKADELSSSISDLISQYEKLGDTDNWDTDDLETAKNLNEEIVETLKGQEGVSNALLYKLDLQNGKYQDQLDLLRQIQKEQLQAANGDLTDEKDSAGNVLRDTAKKKLNTEGTYVFGTDRQMADYVQRAIGGSSVNATFYDFYQLGTVDLNDADSVLEYYNKLQHALNILESKYTTTELSASKFYNWLKSNLTELKESAVAYQNASDALQTNSEKLGKFSLSEYIAANNPDESVKSTNSEIDAKIKAAEEYKNAVKEAEDTEEE